MDGIDISLVKTNGIILKRLNKNFYYKYSCETKKILDDILKTDININLKKKSFLDEFITKEHYSALKDLDIVQNCDLVGFHGQTIHHNPINKISIQLGDLHESQPMERQGHCRCLRHDHHPQSCDWMRLHRDVIPGTAYHPERR